MLGRNNSVKINCRKCGQPAESDKFVLDPVYKMMVCPTCVQQRKSQSAMTAMRKPSQPAVPPSQAQLSPAAQARASSKSVSAAEYRASVEARISPSSQPKPKAPEAPKPAGWDEDDIELERLAKAKSSESAPKVERISDDKLKVTCAKCKYRFTYSISTQTPTSCPYCGREVEKPRSY